MKTQWDKVRQFINSREVGYEFTRKELRNHFPNKSPNSSWYYNPNQGCSYIPLLEKCKYIVRVKRSTYKIVEHINDLVTTGDIHCLLKGDNLSYVERLQNRKDKKVVTDLHAKHLPQFRQEREKSIVKLMEEIAKLQRDSFTYLKYDINIHRLTQLFNELSNALKKQPTKVTDLWLNSDNGVVVTPDGKVEILKGDPK